MAENDLGDNNRILASISNGTGTSGMLAAVVSNIGGSIKSHPSAMTSDPQGASVSTQPQVQVLSHAPPPTQQHQQQPQQTLSHHSHSSLSSQPTTASVGDGGGVGAGSSGGEGGASHVSEGVIVNTDDVPKAQPGNFGIGLATPTSQLLQHQQQQQQQHQLFLLQHQQQQQQQQQQQEHQRQFNELQEQEQRRLLQESIQPMPPVEPRRELTQSDEILIPSQEQEYESLEAAQHAAERYARSVNTVVIVKRTTKDKHGNVVQKDLACERQGSYIGTAKKTPEAYNIRTKRCGCPWMISVGFSKKRGNRDGKRGRFTKLSLEHNHPLQPLPEDAPAGPSKLTLKDLRSGQTSVPKPEISASTSSRTQTSRARSSASKSAAAAAQALSSESSGPVKTNAAKGRAKDLDKENNESKGDAAASLDESRQLSNYNMATFLPQAAILSSDRVSTVPSVSLPAGLQPSSNALGPLSSDVMSALGANAHDIHRPLQGIGRTDITWDDLKTQMSHIPWDLQSDAMKALMDVLQLTLQTYQVPTIGSNRHADAEASAAATAAAIADVVGSLPANYNPSTSHTQEQPHSHQPIQQPQAQAPPPPPTSFARHHNLSSSRAGPSAMEGISHNLAGTTSTSELLQLHRADTGELNGGRERGHRRQGSSASGPIQGSGSDGSTAIMTSQPPSTQVSTAIPSVVSSLPPSANPTAPSTPSALSTTASPLLTAVPTLRNVIHGHMAPSVEPLQGSFLQHSRQSSHSGAGHHRTQSGSLANVNQGIHALDSNGTLLGHNHSQSNGTSNNSSMDSSPLISQTQTLLDAAARVHNNQSEAQRQAEEQAQIQAQVNADTEAAVNAALNMNALQGPTASGSALSGTANSGHVGSTVSVSNANATSSPIPLNLLDAVSMNTLPNFTQQLLQQQQRLQQLQQQQQQHQQHQQQHQQQQQQPPQQPVHTHLNDVEKDGGSDLALSEPPRKRVKQEALYAPEQQ